MNEQRKDKGTAMTAKEKLIDYIMNLTPEQVEKIIAKLDELKQLASIYEERTETA